MPMYTTNYTHIHIHTYIHTCVPTLHVVANLGILLTGSVGRVSQEAVGSRHPTQFVVLWCRRVMQQVCATPYSDVVFAHSPGTAPSRCLAPQWFVKLGTSAKQMAGPSNFLTLGTSAKQLAGPAHAQADRRQSRDVSTRPSAPAYYERSARCHPQACYIKGRLPAETNQGMTLIYCRRLLLPA